MQMQKKPEGSGTKKASIMIASLNIKGYGHVGAMNNGNKWNHVNQVMREKRIGVLVVQEAHMTKERREDVETIVQSLSIHANPDPEAPVVRGGVAIVINKKFVKLDHTEHYIVIPGRVSVTKINLYRGETLTIMGVYAPNNRSENAQFWRDLEMWCQQHPNLTPNMLIGDFNITEDAIDRMPMQEDEHAQLIAIDSLKQYLQLVDGWRETFPTKQGYTFRQMNGTNSQSRID